MLSRSNDARTQDLIDIQHLLSVSVPESRTYSVARVPFESKSLASFLLSVTLLQLLSKAFNTNPVYCQGFFISICCCRARIPNLLGLCSRPRQKLWPTLFSHSTKVGKIKSLGLKRTYLPGRGSERPSG